MGLGIGLGLLALAAVTIFLILFARRRRSSEAAVSVSQDSASAEPAESWANVVHEDDEEFGDYVNPLDSSNGREDSDYGFVGDLGE
jgi:hypothetical protein